MPWSSGESLSPSILNLRQGEATLATGYSTNTLAPQSGLTVEFLSDISVQNTIAAQRVELGGAPSNTSALASWRANSAVSDYLFLQDAAGIKHNFLLGLRTGDSNASLVDGLNLYDTSANTMIVRFSSDSVRFYPPIVAPVFDSGGALASTYNAALFLRGSSRESQIQAAINAAAADNVARVYVPASLYPYSAASISFSTRVRMVREGGDWSVYDVQAYGAAGNGVADDTAAFRGALNQAAAGGLVDGQGHTVYVPQGTYELTSQITVGGSTLLQGETGGGARLQANAVFPNSGGTDQTDQYMIKLGPGGGGVHNNFIVVANLFLECNGNANGIFADDLNLGCVLRNIYINNYGSSAGTPFGVRCDGGAYPGSFGPNALLAENVTVARAGYAGYTGYGMSFENASFSPILIGCGAQSNAFGVGHSAGFRTTNCPLVATACWTDIGGIEGFQIGGGSSTILDQVGCSNQSVGVHLKTTSLNNIVRGVYNIGSTTTLIVDDGGGATPASTLTTTGAGGSIGLYISSHLNISRPGHVPIVEGIAASLNNILIPSYTFASELSLGWYRSGASKLALSYGQLITPDGTSILPSHAFASEASLGLYRSATSTIALSYGNLLVPAVLTVNSKGQFSVGVTNNGLVVDKIGSTVARMRFFVGDGTVGTVADENYIANNNTGLHIWGGASAATELLEINSSRQSSRVTSINYFQSQQTDGTTTAPGYGFLSEVSLGFYRSGVSTVALSYGSLNLNQTRLISIRTQGSLDSTTLAQGELAIAIAVASGASMALRSGNTIYYWTSSASTKG